jgi:hypothetical protein
VIGDGIEVGKVLAPHQYELETDQSLGRSLLHLEMEGKRREAEMGWRGK